MLDVKIQTAPRHLVRCDQLGDWHINGRILVRVLENTISEESELAVAIHELVEAFLCRRDGVTDEAVVEFDTMFEKEREAGYHSETDEDGDDFRAPYREQHMKATHVERAVCHALGITWEQHCQPKTE